MGRFITLPSGQVVRVGDKKPPEHDCRTLRFEQYAADLGDPAAETNNAAAVSAIVGTDWGMMGNGPDTWKGKPFAGAGDCGVAGPGHEEMVWSANAGQIFIPTTDQILADYETISGWNGIPDDPSDSGVCLQDVLKQWRKIGIAGRKIGAWMDVRPTNVRHMQQAITWFDGLDCGWLLPDAWLNAPPGQKWDVGPGVTVNPNNGHCMPVIDYNAWGVLAVTWAGLQWISWAGVALVCDEAHVIASPDQINPLTGQTPQGWALPSMLANLSAVTG
jgi:hypothetical protein